MQLLMSDIMEPLGFDDRPHPYWSELDIPIGPAILVIGESSIDELDGATPECLIQVDDWTGVPEQLGELMDRYSARAESDFSSYSRHLRSAIHTADGQGGSYFDHVGCLESLEGVPEWLWRPDEMLAPRHES
jgi:hypothetical protein